MPLAIFEQVDGAEQVVLNELASAGFSVHPGKHAWIGRSIYHPICRRYRLHVCRAADIRVHYRGAELQQFQSVSLAPRTDEIVGSDEFEARAEFAQASDDRRTDKPARPCNKNFH